MEDGRPKAPMKDKVREAGWGEEVGMTTGTHQPIRALESRLLVGSCTAQLQPVETRGCKDEVNPEGSNSCRVPASCSLCSRIVGSAWKRDPRSMMTIDLEQSGGDR
jgi:hypothetical protein